MKPVVEFAKAEIARWEGKLSLDPNDDGNWYKPGAAQQRKGQGERIGSNYGVTGATLARFLGRSNVTTADIRALTIDDAAAIMARLFYSDVGLQNLAWARPTASVLDFGWGAGPGTGIRQLQALLGVAQDGVIGVGGETATAFQASLTAGEEELAKAWCAQREKYYAALVQRRPSDALYIHGWDNRSEYFLPDNPEGWWKANA